MKIRIVSLAVKSLLCLAILSMPNQVSLNNAHAVVEEPLMILDENTDFSKLHFKTNNISKTSSTPERFDGDASRFYKTTDEGYYTYEVPEVGTQAFSSFEVVTWYNKGQTGDLPGDMSFEASADDSSYSSLANISKMVSTEVPVAGWVRIAWEAPSLPTGTKYIKIVFGDTTLHPQPWSIQIGKTTLYVEDISLQVLRDEITASTLLLGIAVTGTAPGTFPQHAVEAFEQEIATAQAIVDNDSSTETERQSAYYALVLARQSFEESIILVLNWPASAQLTASSTGLHHITLSWPHIVEFNENPNTMYHIYQNGNEVGATSDPTYTLAGLRPQMDYEFSIIAQSEQDSSKWLGPVTLSTNEVGLVPAPDFDLMDVNDFADLDYVSPQVWLNDNRGIPYYFKHFHTVANAVSFEEPHRGFIDIMVHRSPDHNLPFNARVQENHLWFTYFYTNPASWNIYYEMPEVKYRLEEVLEHLLTLQSPDGSFSQYAWELTDLAATTFAVQFLGQTIRLLNEAEEHNPSFPAIDEDLYNRIVEADRKAIVHVLNDNARWERGTADTNQYTLMWSATAAYLAYYPDQSIEDKMRERFTQSSTAFISPAGFYYENNGYDMGYNLGVHVQNLIADYSYFKDTDLEEEWVEKESKFIDWLSYNLVREPDGSYFTSNAAASGRTESIHIKRKDFPIAEMIPMARAFVRTQEEIAAEIAQAKIDITKGSLWPNVPQLGLRGGNSYNPFAMYNRMLYLNSSSEWSNSGGNGSGNQPSVPGMPLQRYYPNENQRAEAISMLPYMASERFNHQRIDGERSELQFTYVRRPEYYTAFNAGPRKSNLQAFGIGLIWHPEGGVMLSSQTEHSSPTSSRGLSWGTKNATSLRVYESGDVQPSYRMNEQIIQPTIGYGDLDQGDMEIVYNLGASGDKTISYGEEDISVAVNHQGGFAEQIPLMVASDDIVTIVDGSLSLVRGNVILEIDFDESIEVELIEKDFRIYDKTLKMLTLETSDSLNYTISLSTVE